MIPYYRPRAGVCLCGAVFTKLTATAKYCDCCRRARKGLSKHDTDSPADRPVLDEAKKNIRRFLSGLPNEAR